MVPRSVETSWARSVANRLDRGEVRHLLAEYGSDHHLEGIPRTGQAQSRVLSDDAGNCLSGLSAGQFSPGGQTRPGLSRQGRRELTAASFVSVLTRMCLLAG